MQNPNEKIMMNFRIPSYLVEKLKEVARARGKSLTAFAEEAFELCCSFDESFWKIIKGLSDAYDDAPGRIVQNLVLKSIKDLKKSLIEIQE